MVAPFSVARLPRIEFGTGRIGLLPEIVRGFGTRALIITGSSSFVDSLYWHSLTQGLADKNVNWLHERVSGEPSPALVDDIVQRLRDYDIACVLGIGGGSALDAAKAVAGLLRPGNSVMDHLEGVGPQLPYLGPSTPFIAVPTTAGTGSEATKNAVLSVQGAEGFKKSFRDDKLVAEYAVIDPDLLASCPLQVIAANGMDAFTQLLESYVSSRANPLTDALALSGLELVGAALPSWFSGDGDIATHRSRMAYGALLSGITLAQVGLGSVHGLASPLGAFFPIPHGVVCGTLVGAATRTNLQALRERDPDSPALHRYAQVGRLLSRQPLSQPEAHTFLLTLLENWTRLLQLPRLSAYGVTPADVDRIVAHSRGSSMKTNPITLSDAEIARIVEVRL